MFCKHTFTHQKKNKLKNVNVEISHKLNIIHNEAFRSTDRIERNNGVGVVVNIARSHIIVADRKNFVQ